METAPFGEGGLNPKQLEKEEAIVTRAIDSVQEAIKEIDFKVIDQILFTILKKAYPELSSLQFHKNFSFDGVYPIRVKYSQFMDLSHYGSSFENEGGHASAYYDDDNIVVFAREHVDDEGNMHDDQKPALIKTLIHEAMHLMSTAVYEKKSDTWEAWTGVTKQRSSEDTSEKLESLPYMRLNEALTEVVADAVYSEYLARTGSVTTFEEKSKWYKKESHIDRNAGYISERMALATLVDMLAKHSGVDEGRVYQALAVEYLKNGDLMRSEMLEEYKETDDIRSFLDNLKQNKDETFPSFSDEKIEEISAFLSVKELTAIKALVSRDYIGEVNKRRVMRRKWYNVVH